MKIICEDKALFELKKWKIDDNELLVFEEAFLMFIKSLKENRTNRARENKYFLDISTFLKSTFYNGEYEVKPYGDTDLAIFKNNSLFVIFELKTPFNTSEMVNDEDFNRKAFHEILWSYLEGTRYVRDDGGISLKPGATVRNVVITNFDYYYVIKPSEVEKVLKHNNNYVVSVWKRYINGQSLDNSKKSFYEEIKVYLSSQNILDKMTVSKFSFNDLRKTSSGKKKLFRMFNVDYLASEKRQKSYNKHVLKKAFYDELLYIAGLKEVPDGNSKTIIQIDKKREQFIAPQVYKICLEDKDYDEEKAYESAFQLTIIWLNRLLFLKLFEGQLIKINENSINYRILDNNKISDFQQLNSLFFDVLGKEIHDRAATSFLDKFKLIPYLNSSLFELSDIEKEVINIKQLSNDEVEIYSKSIIKGETKLPLIKYIFDFFDNWDFGSSINETDDETKIDRIIDASVLGLIFEKINGYKDGSFYTPSEITEFLAKQAVERLLISRYNETHETNFKNIIEIKEALVDLDKRKEVNQLIDGFKFCDPAVGSGHFLVSLLNRIIALKSELSCLFYYESDERITAFKIEVVNDEIIVKNGQGEIFSYNKEDFESQRIQKSLFNEKRIVIENCLFGADLNPNAVEICRLRLWIELLKNPYYENGIMQTLPNIDININCGDSLLGTYSLKNYGIISSNYLEENDKNVLKEYKRLIRLYKQESNKQEKKNIKAKLKELSSILKEVLNPNRTYHQMSILGEHQDISSNEESKVIQWLLEFPDLLNEDGGIKGFDCVIGNPPFIQIQKLKSREKLKKLSYETFEGLGDIYCMFIELAYYLLNNNGLLCFITSNKWLRSGYGEKLRNFLVRKTNPLVLIDLGSGVFDNATVDSSILIYEKSKYERNTTSCKASKYDIDNLENCLLDNSYELEFVENQNWVISSPIESSIRQKIESLGKPLSEWDVEINYGIKTGANDVFIINEETKNKLIEEDPRSAEIIRPILRGKDIKRYGFEIQKYILAIHNGIQKENIPPVNISKYTSVKNYMDSKKDILEKRQDKGVSIYNLRSCAYMDNFYKQKLVWTAVNSEYRFAMVPENIFLNNSLFMITGKNIEYLLAILNSKLYQYYISSILSGENYAYGSSSFFEKLKILDCSDSESFKKLIEFSLLVTEKNVDGEDVGQLLKEIDDIVFQLYGISADEINEINNFLNT